jgi:hypothetical protein
VFRTIVGNLGNNFSSFESRLKTMLIIDSDKKDDKNTSKPK